MCTVCGVVLYSCTHRMKIVCKCSWYYTSYIQQKVYSKLYALLKNSLESIKFYVRHFPFLISKVFGVNQFIGHLILEKIVSVVVLTISNEMSLFQLFPQVGQDVTFSIHIYGFSRSHACAFLFNPKNKFPIPNKHSHAILLFPKRSKKTF